MYVCIGIIYAVDYWRLFVELGYIRQFRDFDFVFRTDGLCGCPVLVTLSILHVPWHVCCHLASHFERT